MLGLIFLSSILNGLRVILSEVKNLRSFAYAQNDIDAYNL